MRRFYQQASTWFFRVCACAVLVFRIAYVAAYPYVYCHADSPTYFFTATRWLETGRLEFHYLRTPVYPVFLLVLERLAGVHLLALVQHITLAGAIVLLGWLFTRLYPGSWGRVLAGVFVLFSGFAPSQLIYASAMLTEGVLVQALALVILCFCLWDKKPNDRWLVLFSFSVALTVLLRPGAVVLVLAAVLSITARCRKKVLRPLAVFLVSACVFVSGWVAYNKLHNNRLALANMMAMPLVHSYGHLLNMDSPRYKAEKDVIRDRYQTYMHMRQGMSDEDLLFAGGFLAWGSGSIQAMIARAFSLTEAQTESRVRALVMEGILAHPREAARLVLQRLAALYTRTPAQMDLFYNRFINGPGPLDTSSWDMDENSLKSQGISAAPAHEQSLRNTRAKPCLLFASRLAPFFSRASLGLFWASILLFPCVLFSRRAVLGLFLFAAIHANMLLLALTVPPEPRFYQPFMVMTWFLAAMEMLSVPDAWKAYAHTRRQGSPAPVSAPGTWKGRASR